MVIEMNVEQKTVTRADIASAVSRRIGFSWAESSRLVAQVLDELGNSLAKEDVVKISSFGTFTVREKKERIGRNPKTKVEVPIKARRVVSFHPSASLRKMVNK
jgi:integration host factor subunit alpha